MRVLCGRTPGHGGLRHLRRLTAGVSRPITRNRSELDLARPHVQCGIFRPKSRMCDPRSSKSRRIHANNAFPAEFIYDNLIIEANLIEAQRASVEAPFPGLLLHLPPEAPQP